MMKSLIVVRHAKSSWDDHSIAEAVRSTVHDRNTGVAVAAERAFLRQLEGGCQVPVAAFAEQQGRGSLRLLGRVISLGGETTVEDSVIDNAKTVSVSSDKNDAERLHKWLESLDPEDLGKYKM